MKNVFPKDYAVKNGKTPLTKENFNEVDAAILNFLPLIQADKCIPLLGNNKKVTFKEVVDKQLKVNKSRKMGLLLKPHLYNLLLAASKQPRYQKLMVHSLYYRISNKDEYQMVFFVIDIDEKSSIIVFGGTNDYIAGWKEDFNMMYVHHIPSLDPAVKYLNEVTNNIKNFFVIGHSKGGHVALYAISMAEQNVKNKMIKTLVYDCPGFWLDELEVIKRQGEDVASRCNLYLPQGSLVGRLFNHCLKPIITKSTFKRLNQHDLSSWLVEGDHFIRSERFTTGSTKLVERANEIMGTYSPIESEAFVRSLLKIVSVGHSETLTQLSRHYVLALHTFINLEKTEKRRIINLLELLLDEDVLIKELFPPLALFFKPKKKHGK